MAKIRSKFDKMPVLELVLENAWKNNENPCLWILKNSGFAWEVFDFSRFPVSSKSLENYSRNGLKMSPKSFKKWFGGFPKTQFKTAMKNNEHLLKKRSPKRGYVFYYFLHFFEVWVQMRLRVVPGTLPGSIQGQKITQTWSQNDSKIINKCCPEAF